jgi:hypothetical protein
MNATKTIETVTPVLAACGFSCKPQGTAEIVIFDKKGRLAGHITAKGVQEQRSGKQNLLGALLKRNLTDAILAAGEEPCQLLRP